MPCAQSSSAGGFARIPNETNEKDAEDLERIQNSERHVDDLDGDLMSIIQLSSNQFYCREGGNSHVTVDVVRIGDSSGEASVHVRTEDASAKKGIKYKAKTERLVFKAGERMTAFTVELIEDQAWGSSLEFEVFLSDAHGAQLGKYLAHARVIIIDDDAFPTNKFRREMIAEGNMSTQDGASMMIQFLLMNFRIPDIRWKTLLIVFLDFIKNLYFIYMLFLQMYLVDVVIMGPERMEVEEFEHEPEAEREAAANEERDREHGGHSRGRQLLAVAARMLMPHMHAQLIIPGDRRSTVVVVGMLYILPFMVMNAIDLIKISLRVPGISRKFLQEHLFRTYLHYREKARAEMSVGDFTMAMMRDTLEVVDNGYMKVLVVIQTLSKLGLSLAFVISNNKAASLPLSVFPVIMIVFICCRAKMTIDANELFCSMENRLVQDVNNVVHNIQLISGFTLRPFISKRFVGHIDRHNACKKGFGVIMINNLYLPPWLTTITVGLYMIFGTFQVRELGGAISLGTFLATINVFKQIGTDLQILFAELVEIVTSFGPLGKLCFFMNVDTDLMDRMETSERLRERAKEEWAALLREGSGSIERQVSPTGANRRASVKGENGMPVFMVDELKIKLFDLGFEYEHTSKALAEHTAQAPRKHRGPVFKGITHDFDQGKLYAFVGQQHSGKSTLLRVIGHAQLPSTGNVQMPSHIRVIHIVQQVNTIAGTLEENLIMGRNLHELGGMTRIRSICALCGFSERMQNLLDHPMSDDANDLIPRNYWFSGLSMTEAARLNLARVLVINPECLVAHFPMMFFNDDQVPDLFGLFRIFVDNRGVELPAEQSHMRRKRTVFVSSRSEERALGADEIYELGAQGACHAQDGLYCIMPK